MHDRASEIVGDPELEAAVDKLVERARKSSRARQHHLVPASYLSRWAVGDRVHWLDLESGRTQTQSPAKMARERDYYRLPVEELPADEDLPEMLFETLLSEVEGEGKTALDMLLEKGRLAASSKERLDLSLFMAVQFVRGERGRATVRESASSYVRTMSAGHDDTSVAQLLTQRGIDPTPEEVEKSRRALEMLADGTLRAEPHTATQMAWAAMPALQIAQHLSKREWVIYHCEGLITGDEPVVTIGGPGHDRRVIAGFESAAVVVFPLAPDALLVMHQPGRLRYPKSALNSKETAQANLEIAGNSTRLLFDQPGHDRLARLDLPARPSISLQWDDLGDVVHTYRRSRWANATTPPPWPVSRWYR